MALGYSTCLAYAVLWLQSLEQHNNGIEALRKALDERLLGIYLCL
jgi:hypothetical protein